MGYLRVNAPLALKCEGFVVKKFFLTGDATRCYIVVMPGEMRTNR
nr:MAG TPA: hypothetical protein [Bacteriophage sp.]